MVLVVWSSGLLPPELDGFLQPVLHLSRRLHHLYNWIWWVDSSGCYVASSRPSGSHAGGVGSGKGGRRPGALWMGVSGGAVFLSLISQAAAAVPWACRAWGCQPGTQLFLSGPQEPSLTPQHQVTVTGKEARLRAQGLGPRLRCWQECHGAAAFDRPFWTSCFCLGFRNATQGPALQLGRRYGSASSTLLPWLQLIPPERPREQLAG